MRERQHEEGDSWAKSSVVDEEAIDHERIMGSVLLADGEVVLVRVAQRIDFDLLTDPIATIASAPRITLGGAFELTAVQALEVAQYLEQAAAMIDEVESRPFRPRLITEDPPGTRTPSHGQDTMPSVIPSGSEVQAQAAIGR